MIMMMTMTMMIITILLGRKHCQKSHTMFPQCTFFQFRNHILPLKLTLFIDCTIWPLQTNSPTTVIIAIVIAVAINITTVAPLFSFSISNYNNSFLATAVFRRREINYFDNTCTTFVQKSRILTIMSRFLKEKCNFDNTLLFLPRNRAFWTYCRAFWCLSVWPECSAGDLSLARPAQPGQAWPVRPGPARRPPGWPDQATGPLGGQLFVS